VKLVLLTLKVSTTASQDLREVTVEFASA